MTSISLPSGKISEAMVEAVLREHFAYNAETGCITWIKGWGCTFAHAAGKPAFCSVTSEGYLHGKFCQRTMKAHRVAWFLHHGTWPKGIIDHVNGVKTDNRLENLRDVDRVVNGRNRNLSRNNTTGVNGVCYRAKYNNFAASIRVKGKRQHIGTFPSADEASTAIRSAYDRLGFTARHGLPSNTPEKTS